MAIESRIDGLSSSHHQRLYRQSVIDEHCRTLTERLGGTNYRPMKPDCLHNPWRCSHCVTFVDMREEEIDLWDRADLWYGEELLVHLKEECRQREEWWINCHLLGVISGCMDGEADDGIHFELYRKFVDIERVRRFIWIACTRYEFRSVITRVGFLESSKQAFHHLCYRAGLSHIGFHDGTSQSVEELCAAGPDGDSGSNSGDGNGDDGDVDGDTGGNESNEVNEDQSEDPALLPMSDSFTEVAGML